MIAIYCRVSTLGQEDNYSLPKQREDGKAFALKMHQSYEIYEDIESGASTTRKSYLQLLQDIASGKIDTLWIGSLDRLSRSASAGALLLETLEKFNITFYVGHEIRNPKDPSITLLLQMEFSIGEYERKKIAQRTLTGRIASINAGNRKSHSIYGYDTTYDKDGNRQLIINDNEAEVVKLVYQMFLKGKTLRAIANDLNSRSIPTKLHGKKIKARGFDRKEVLRPIWKSNHVENLLIRPEFSGKVWDWEKTNLIEATYVPAILPERDWQQVQDMLPALNQQRNRNGIRLSQHPLSGIIRCADCNAQFYYRDLRYQQYYSHNINNAKAKVCHNSPKYLPAAALESLFANAYFEFISNTKEVEAYFKSEKRKADELTAEIDAQIVSTYKRIEQLRQEIDQLTDEYLSTKVVALRTNIQQRAIDKETSFKQVEDTLANLHTKKLSILEDANRLSEQSEHDKFINRVGKSGFLKANPSEERNIYLSVIKSATVHDNMLTIELINSKRFDVQVTPKKGNVPSSFASVKMYYKGKFQSEKPEFI